MFVATGLTKFVNDGERQVLHGVDITLKPGQLTALIGPSGSGKTTVLRALSLLDAPSGGTIRVDGDSYMFPRLPEQADLPLSPCPWPKVTAVFQQLFLWPHLTLRENILLPVRGRAGAEKRLKELSKLFDMDDFLDRYPNETSGGQRQRAAVARAIILEPKYVLLDEITSALDIETSARVLECLTELKERGIGMLLITHAINFARKSADSVVFMDAGKVIEAGAPSILDKPKSARLRAFVESVKAAS